MTVRMPLSRRSLLKVVGLGGAAIWARTHTAAFAQGQSYDKTTCPLFIFATFAGGWDTLLGPDPRDATQFTAGSGVEPAWDSTRGSIQDDLPVDVGDAGIYEAGPGFVVGPAMAGLAKDHWQDICIVRGMDMGTLTHDVGTRHFLTGKFPRGLAANGSSMTTAAVGEAGNLGFDMPNLVVGMETYNENQPTYATGLAIANPTDILALVRPLTDTFADRPATMEAIRAHANKWDCAGITLDGRGAVSGFREAIPSAERLASGVLAEHFDFLSSTGLPQSTTEALQHFGIKKYNDMSTGRGQAFLAAQALTQGIAQSVSIQLASGLDHHDDDWATDHAPALLGGFDALGSLMTFLKERFPDVWSRTIVLASSEFARTPNINSRDGRDHHLSNACILAGAGIKGGVVFGGTSDTYTRYAVDPVTGEPGDTLIRPPDVHATVFEAAGLPWEHLSNQSPVVLEGILS